MPSLNNASPWYRNHNIRSQGYELWTCFSVSLRAGPISKKQDPGTSTTLHNICWYDFHYNTTKNNTTHKTPLDGGKGEDLKGRKSHHLDLGNRLQINHLSLFCWGLLSLITAVYTANPRSLQGGSALSAGRSTRSRAWNFPVRVRSDEMASKIASVLWIANVLWLCNNKQQRQTPSARQTHMQHSPSRWARSPVPTHATIQRSRFTHAMPHLFCRECM